MANVNHSFMIGPPCFIVFNDDDDLPLDPVTLHDLEVVHVHPSAAVQWCRSCAWSSNVDWFFVIEADHILLLNVWSDRGARCRKRSAAFIGFCLDHRWLK